MYPKNNEKREWVCELHKKTKNIKIAFQKNKKTKKTKNQKNMFSCIRPNSNVFPCIFFIKNICCIFLIF